MTLVDNNVLSSLAKIDRLELLNSLFKEVATTPSVLDELQSDKVSGYDFVNRIDDNKHYNSGWLHIRSPTEQDIALTEGIVDASLSFTDAECIAIAERRGERLLTDDGHAGEIASQRGDIDVWDLALFIEGCVKKGLIKDEGQLNTLLQDLHQQDCYRFSQSDRNRMYDRF
jgi:predicted nucleic acid-binding protein